MMGATRALALSIAALCWHIIETSDDPFGVDIPTLRIILGAYGVTWN